MTETEWLMAVDPTPMLEFLKGKASDRKLRLFAVTCCRAVWEHVTHGRSKRAVEIAEQYAEGQVDDKELNRAHSMAYDAIGRHQAIHSRGGSRGSRGYDRHSLTIWSLMCVASATHVHKPFLIGRLRRLTRHPKLSSLAAPLLRESFGQLPFKPVLVENSWRSPTVLTLANGIYAERAFDRMPILADALEDAGCDNSDILDHCRQPGEHVKGCWCVDLILGRD